MGREHQRVRSDPDDLAAAHASLQQEQERKKVVCDEGGEGVRPARVRSAERGTTSAVTSDKRQTSGRQASTVVTDKRQTIRRETIRRQTSVRPRTESRSASVSRTPSLAVKLHPFTLKLLKIAH